MTKREVCENVNVGDNVIITKSYQQEQDMRGEIIEFEKGNVIVTVETGDKIEHVHLPEFRSKEDCVQYIRNKGSKYDGPKEKITENGDAVLEFTLKEGFIF